ncbi:lysozyme family protein [Halobacillus karajensis]|uniref:CwlT-like lysozyme domain-containing protein n=1 Tax=Halobacillus karajensis TaxID=195088 RepID=A0A024P7U8_9BACI|nr:lysozyme family protein [Halobacillus karajensis]CDQ20911.1 hypothetical protein BN982_03270 [Halobacillus karajensis]CDQ25025.1 hypothetical protein BN983_03327 [Halobacillus karajensis]CDQ28614.1 hypothetical protein BN981_02925 [Halobacillus karajensis]
MTKKNKRKKKTHGGAFLLPVFLLILVYVSMKSQLGDGMMSSLTEGDEGPDLSPQVLQYEDEVAMYAEQEGIGEYTDILLALMMQESGGRGKDPMQASESLCGSVGCIDDPEHSIKQGVAYFAGTLEQADGDVKLALQSYNCVKRS